MQLPARGCFSLTAGAVGRILKYDFEIVQGLAGPGLGNGRVQGTTVLSVPASGDFCLLGPLQYKLHSSSAGLHRVHPF